MSSFRCKYACCFLLRLLCFHFSAPSRPLNVPSPSHWMQRCQTVEMRENGAALMVASVTPLSAVAVSLQQCYRPKPKHSWIFSQKESLYNLRSWGLHASPDIHRPSTTFIQRLGLPQWESQNITVTSKSQPENQANVVFGMSKTKSKHIKLLTDFWRGIVARCSRSMEIKQFNSTRCCFLVL